MVLGRFWAVMGPKACQNLGQCVLYTTAMLAYTAAMFLCTTAMFIYTTAMLAYTTAMFVYTTAVCEPCHRIMSRHSMSSSHVIT